MFSCNVKAVPCGPINVYFTKMNRFLLWRISQWCPAGQDSPRRLRAEWSPPLFVHRPLPCCVSVRVGVLRTRSGESGAKGNENEGKGFHVPWSASELALYGSFLLIFLVHSFSSVCCRPRPVPTTGHSSQHCTKCDGEDLDTEIGAQGNTFSFQSNRPSMYRTERRRPWYWHLVHAF